MADIHSKETRSYNMSKVKSKDTKPEMIVRKYLHSRGFRYRLHVANIPGKPDIVLPKLKTVILVHGCFWHGHMNCKYAAIPKTRTDWWEDKIQKNMNNDIKVRELLIGQDWNIIQVWGCELKPKVRERTLVKLIVQLESKFS